ncbi:MAG: hypothetical protein ACK5KQ_00410 [Anaerorhabdus sp.]
MKNNYNSMNRVVYFLKKFLLEILLVVPFIVLVDKLFFGLSFAEGVMTQETFSKTIISIYSSLMLNLGFVFVLLAAVNAFTTWFIFRSNKVMGSFKFSTYILLLTMGIFYFYKTVYMLATIDYTTDILFTFGWYTFVWLPLLVICILDVIWFKKYKSIK